MYAPRLSEYGLRGCIWINQNFSTCAVLWKPSITLSAFYKLQKKKKTDTPYPALRELATDICVFPQPITRINNILDKFGKIKDNASAELLRIRRELSATTGSISRSLNSILRSAQSEGYVDKDVTPTMRDGRLVIPIAPGMKRKIRGIVHDESATGKTVFIEPAEVVEANNRIRELEGEERREIIRILTEFSATVRPQIPEILSLMNSLPKLILSVLKLYSVWISRELNLL